MPIDSRTPQTVFLEVKRKAGLNKLSFHSLRHSFARHLLENGVDIKYIKDPNNVRSPIGIVGKIGFWIQGQLAELGIECIIVNLADMILLLMHIFYKHVIEMNAQVPTGFMNIHSYIDRLSVEICFNYP